MPCKSGEGDVEGLSEGDGVAATDCDGVSVWLALSDPLKLMVGDEEEDGVRETCGEEEGEVCFLRFC